MCPTGKMPLPRMSTLTKDYDYPLPERLIARHPLPQRDASRMLVLDRATGRIEHRRFTDFPSYLRADDLVVLNDTQVMPARVFSDDRRVELLFVEAIAARTWKCLVKPGRKMKVGATVQVGGSSGTVMNIEPDGARIIQFSDPLDLDAVGELPLPPYLGRGAEREDATRYQTVFARKRGAIAAPTAGLHFTPEMLAAIRHTFVTLHVGVGTFRPVQAADVREHSMHPERFGISDESARAINAAPRLLAIGTTTARLLETLGRPVAPGEGVTDIFIHPPYQFRAVDVLLTNFHLPKSTLLMLVSAFAGREFVLKAYAEAICAEYRFFSYGDCMLIL